MEKRGKAVQNHALYFDLVRFFENSPCDIGELQQTPLNQTPFGCGKPHARERERESGYSTLPKPTRHVVGTDTIEKCGGKTPRCLMLNVANNQFYDFIFSARRLPRKVLEEFASVHLARQSGRGLVGNVWLALMLCLAVPAPSSEPCARAVRKLPNHQTYSDMGGGIDYAWSHTYDESLNSSPLVPSSALAITASDGQEDEVVQSAISAVHVGGKDVVGLKERWAALCCGCR